MGGTSEFLVIFLSDGSLMDVGMMLCGWMVDDGGCMFGWWMDDIC